jgi:hypothetical protein
MRYSADMTKLSDVMGTKGITPHKLAQLTGSNLTKMYAYFKDNGPPMPEDLCIRIADEVSVPLAELFPTMIDKSDPDLAIDTAEDQGVDDMGRKIRLVANDMIVGCQTSVPEDGVTLRVNRVINGDGVEFPGYQLNPDEQVIVRTGVSDRNIDPKAVFIRLKQRLIEKHALSNLVYPLVREHELCVVVHSYGVPLMLSKGVEFAEIQFL